MNICPAGLCVFFWQVLAAKAAGSHENESEVVGVTQWLCDPLVDQTGLNGGS